jgi:hypothetical protein
MAIGLPSEYRPPLNNDQFFSGPEGDCTVKRVKNRGRCSQVLVVLRQIQDVFLTCIFMSVDCRYMV